MVEKLGMRENVRMLGNKHFDIPMLKDVLLFSGFLDSVIIRIRNELI